MTYKHTRRGFTRSRHPELVSGSSCFIKGFTLIELLVVVLIIGILAAIAVPQYQVAVAKARYSELMTLVKHVKTEQEVFFLANGHYAANCNELGIDVPSNTTLASGVLYELNGKFKLACLHGTQTVAGILYDKEKRYAVSYEQFLTHVTDEEGNPITDSGKCWARNTEPTYQKICKMMCAAEADSAGHVECSW